MKYVCESVREAFDDCRFLGDTKYKVQEAGQVNKNKMCNFFRPLSASEAPFSSADHLELGTKMTDENIQVRSLKLSSQSVDQLLQSDKVGSCFQTRTTNTVIF